MPRYGVKLLGYLGMVSFWMGCIVKTGYALPVLQSVPYANWLFWGIAAALIGIEQNMLRRYFHDKNIGVYKGKYIRFVSGSCANIGLMMYIISNLILFVHPGLSLSRAVPGSTLLIGCALVLLLSYEWIEVKGRTSTPAF